MIQKKISMLGMYAVGKTSLVRRFVSSIFDEKYHTTIGVKVDKKTVQLGDEELLLMLWDIAGAEDSFDVPTSFVRGSAGFLLVIDGTRAATLDRGLDIVTQVREQVGDLPFVAVLNKSDLVDEWELDDAKLGSLEALGCPIIRSSAKSGEGVEDSFLALAEKLL